MKKHTYLNKSQKLLLAAMTIPLAVSVLPTAENISASEIPTLNVYELNGSPKLEWATEILQENILWESGFEDKDLIPILYWHKDSIYNNLHYITDEYSFNGSKSYLLNDNSNGKGNHYNFPNTSSNQHLSDYGRLLIPNDIPLSFSFKAKNISENTTSSIRPTADGGRASSFIEYNNKLVKKGNKGDKVLYLNSVEDLSLGLYVTFDKDPNKIDFGTTIISIDKANNSITLNAALSYDVEINSNLKHRPFRMAFDFNERIIRDTNWKNYSLTTNATNYEDYDSLIRGANLYIYTKTDNQLLVDDIKLGYATEVEVYRDGQSIYKGYLSDFHDTSIKDNVKPNKVEKINSSITNDFNIHFNITKPDDNGIKTNYQIQSISKNGTKSALSNPQAVEIKTDVVKYKYDISNKEIDIPTIETTSLNDLSIPLKSINLENDYIHIQSVDANGNVSDVESFKLNELIDMQDLYDKIKELESNNNYEDFVDFIDEIEGVYGDNLPQDLKEMIDKLGQHHGVNTSFLLLEEGDFSLSTVDIDSFGKVKLTAKKQTITTSFKGDFGIIDARGTQEGWNVSVSATPFEVETFDGFVGIPHQLPIGSLALNAISNIEQVGQVHNSQLPSIMLNQLTTIDGQNTTINLLNAEKNKGMGGFKFTFAPDALALTVNAVTAKIDNVNYPDKNTPYVSTVTWDLISGPKI